MSSDTVQHGVEGLTYLLTESSKLMVRTSENCSVLSVCVPIVLYVIVVVGTCIF